MSTKATIILTSEEHWHEEVCAHWNYGIETDGDSCFVLEFGPEHLVETDEDGTMVVVRPESELGKALASRLLGRKEK